MNIKIKITLYTILFFLFSLGFVDHANAAWYDGSWTYRKKIIVAGQTGAGTNYQVKLLVGQSSGSTGANFHLENHVKSDFGDLRFTDSGGSTLLPYWIESTSGTTPNQTATVWVKVSADLGSNQDIYVYYGNSGATSAASGTNTFLFFDDFSGASLDTNKWLVYGVDSTSQSGGILSASITNKDPNKIIAYVGGAGPTGANLAMRAKFRANTGASVDQRIGLSVKTTTADGRGYNYVLHDFTALNRHEFLDDAVAWGTNNGGIWAKSTWYTEEAYFTNANDIYARFDDGTWYNWTGATARSGFFALNTGGFSETVTNDWDFALIRKINATEPAYSSAIAEESGTPKPVYYSVGQTAGDLKTGTPTVTITSGAAVFSAAQTGNIGIGDRVTYNTNSVAYISAKTNADMAHWTLVTATGGTPADITGSTIVSITHEYTSLSAAIAGASDANHLNTTDLTTGNYVLNIPCYYDTGADTTAVTISGYTTSSTNYIKVYTPTSTTAEANFSQRHQGKYDLSKYRLETSSNTIAISVNYLTIDGLQITMTSSSSNQNGIRSSGLSNGANIKISNNIVVGAPSSSASGWQGITADYYTSGNRTWMIWNNIVYGFKAGTSIGIKANSGMAEADYIYNNTVYGGDTGIQGNSGAVLKNNLSYGNNKDYNLSVNSSSTNNLSKDASAPANNTYYRNASVSFVDAAHGDFHLAQNDTAAREAGADLTNDANLKVTTDIDGHTRPTLGATDIGADEGATYIYYSVGQNTSDHKTGSPTITLSGYNATLSVAQTAPNMGVGDLITYTGGSCYISGKTDTQHWSCQNATGGTAPQVSGVSVTSIAHAFSSLNQAIGISGSAPDLSHLNTKDIYANNYTLNIPCYYDTGADTTNVWVTGWTTFPSNYIKIYTPNNTMTEVNSTQRHHGVWDDTKYSLQASAQAMFMAVGSFRIEGLQIYETLNGAHAIRVDTSSPVDAYISNSIIRKDPTNTGGNNIATVAGGKNSKIYIWNNLIYDSTAGYGVSVSTPTYTGYVYNNTIAGCLIGLLQGNSSTVIAKNNIVIGSGNSNAYAGTFATGTDYNATDGTDNIGVGSNNKISQTFVFVDTTNKNYHLGAGDTAARSSGVSLANDVNLPFSNDIDGEERSGNWSIGADEPQVTVGAIHKSPAQNATAGLDYGLVGYWPFNGDDVSGSTAYDRSGQNNNGTLPAGSAPTATVGIRGQAMSFNGSTSLVSTNTQFSGNFTVAAWVKTTATGGNNTYIATANNSWFWMIDNGSNKMQFYNGSSWTTGTSARVNDGLWHYIAYTSNGTNIVGYVDGVASSTNVYANPAATSGILIGKRNPNYFYNGLIDEFRVYNRALSPTEVMSLYKLGGETVNASQAGTDKNGLVGHWTFDGQYTKLGIGGTAYDSSGQNNNGILSGTAPTQTIGKLGQALSFNGANNFITIPHNATLNPGTAITISFWTKINVAPPNNNNSIINKGGSGGTYRIRGGINTNALQFIQNGAGILSSNNNIFSIGQWIYVTLVSDSSGTTFYKNGAAWGSNTVAYIAASGTSNITIDDGGASSINMALDDVRIYNRALSPAEVGDLYRQGQATVKK